MAMTLSPVEREELAETLLDSLDDTSGDDLIDPAWHEEIGRRVDEIRAGTVTMLTRDQVDAMLAADRVARGM